MIDYTSAQLAQICGVSKYSIIKLAKKQNWPFKECCNDRGGGLKRLFSIYKIPSHIRQKVLAHEINCSSELIPQSNTNIQEIKALVKKWEEASIWNRDRAKARARILEALNDFITKLKYKKKTAAEVSFVSLYKEKAVPGLEFSVYETKEMLSVAKIRRLRALYKNKGLVGLLTKHGNRSGQQKAISPEMMIFIVGQLKNKPHIKPTHLFKLIKKSFQTFPSSRTIRRFINKWKLENEQLYALMENPCRWKNTMMPAFGDMAADIPYFCHTWEMDTTPADVITADNKRCKIVGIIDVYSRRAKVLVAPESTSIAIAACARKAFLDWGLPVRIRKDNGNDYQSHHLLAITSALKIETPLLPKNAPEKKPFIERFFGTLSMQIEELLPGYVGHNVKDRHAIRERETWGKKIMNQGAIVEAPLPIKDLQCLFDRWIKTYEEAPHDGLGGKSPVEMEIESKLQPEKIRDERVFDILLAPIGKRRVQKKGISIDGSYFSSADLVSYVGRIVEVRRDIENAGLIYVFEISGAYLCLAYNDALSGRRLEEYLNAKKRHLKNLKAEYKALNILGNSIQPAAQILLDNEPERHDLKIVPYKRNAEIPSVDEAKKAVFDKEEMLPVEPRFNESGTHQKSRIDPLDNTSWRTPEETEKAYQEAIEDFQKKSECRQMCGTGG